MVKLYRCSLYSLAVFWCSSALAVQVTGNVDVQTLSLGDSLTYTLTAAGRDRERFITNIKS